MPAEKWLPDFVRVLILGAVLALAVPAAGIERWWTPDGGLWFGSNPPEGSVREGDVGRLHPRGDVDGLPPLELSWREKR